MLFRSEVVMEHQAKIAHIYHSNRDIVLFILLCFLPCQSSVHLFIKIILSRLFELPNIFPLNNLSQIHLHCRFVFSYMKLYKIFFIILFP